MRYFFLFLFLLIVSSCEDSQDDSTNPFIGEWYVESAEQFAEFVLNADQTAIPIGSNIAGYRQFDGGITVSVNGIDIVLNYGYPYNIMSSGEDLYLVFTNYSYFELAYMDEYNVPSDYILLQIMDDNAFVAMGNSNTVYMGQVDINCYVDITDPSSYSNLSHSGDLNYLTFNSPALLMNVDSNETVELNGSMQFSTVNLSGNTTLDLYELLYGMDLDELNEQLGYYDDYLLGENDNLKITFSDDGNYSIISSWEESDYNGSDEISETISDTCTGQWTMDGDTITVDLSTEVCSGDEDDEYYYEDEEEDDVELLLGVINSNGNLELSIIESSGFCESGISMITGGSNYFSDNESEEECASKFESEFALESGTASSIALGMRMIFTRTMGSASLRSKNYFNSFNLNKLLVDKAQANKLSIPLLKNFK